MAELFTSTGENSNVSIGTPQMLGIYLPGIDNRFKTDGFGFVTPWGGGATARTYMDYGEGNPDATQLRDLSNSIGMPGSSITYDLAGAVGPQGPMGPPGPPGQIVIQPILFPFGSADPSTVLKQLETWNATTDTLPYGGASHIEWYEIWDHMLVAGIKTWNDFALDHDGSFMLIAASTGIYVSTNTGASWTLKTPSVEAFINVGVSDASGNGIALGDTGRVTGILWKTTDSGANWTEVTVE